MEEQKIPIIEPPMEMKKIDDVIREDLKYLDYDSYLKFLDKKPFISSDHKREYYFGDLLGIMKECETGLFRIIIHSTADVPGCWRLYDGDNMCPEFLIEFGKFIKKFKSVLKNG